MGGALRRERFADDGGNAFDVAQHFVIPKSQHLETLRTKPVGAATILLGLPSMLTAVDFDDEAALQADEIGDVRAERDLAAKFAAGELALAKERP